MGQLVNRRSTSHRVTDQEVQDTEIKSIPQHGTGQYVRRITSINGDKWTNGEGTMNMSGSRETFPLRVEKRKNKANNIFRKLVKSTLEEANSAGNYFGLKQELVA